jgi:hypothetical protein
MLMMVAVSSSQISVGIVENLKFMMKIYNENLDIS